jgi:hypothetical protein
LEEELFEWFLVLRARKISVTNTTLQKKARKIKAKILEDDGINAATKNLYKGFTASDGWTKNFKRRYSLSRRAITTKCEKTVEEMKAALSDSRLIKLLMTPLRKYQTVLVYNLIS